MLVKNIKDIVSKDEWDVRPRSTTLNAKISKFSLIWLFF